jgi:hypothetical protein
MWFTRFEELLKLVLLKIRFTKPNGVYMLPDIDVVKNIAPVSKAKAIVDLVPVIGRVRINNFLEVRSGLNKVATG